MLGLPDGIRAGLFDLDGVLTQTAKVHAQAWKQMFDEYLASLPDPQPPFRLPDDYNEYVDGKPRLDGVRSFLESRSIDPAPELVQELGTRKNELVLELIRSQGVEPYEGSIRYLEAARDASLHRAVVSSSSNAREVLEAAGMLPFFEEIVDGLVAEREGLRGKPAPDSFLAGARALGVEPAEAAVFEDALAGVEAGRAGNFGFVVGVDRTGQADDLKARGADIVVQDLAELLE
ncbi:MAG TPA: beta-phosphoglucomutase family hydrolase [Solirubrobacteraceae bacterium]|nr:beta-phosphoglucomutase family hydrolase [Solirubrobacteraceae bacterium]